MPRNAKAKSLHVDDCTFDQSSDPYSEFAKMPRPGDRLLGLTRGTIYDLAADPSSRVRLARIKQPRAERGITLVHMPSLLTYLRRLAGIE